MIDIHSHLLYGIDDGSRSIVESAYIIKSLSEIGYTDIILTPHFINGSSYMSTRENNLDLLDRLKVELVKHQIPVNLYLGNEIYIDSDIIKLLSLNDIKTVILTKNIDPEFQKTCYKKGAADFIFKDKTLSITSS